MPCLKPDLSGKLQNEYGRKEASTFTGFCSYHDQMTFRPIDDKDFYATEEQIFLYIYRTFVLEYHKKQEAVRIDQYNFYNKPSIINIPDRTIDGKSGWEMAIFDYNEEKSLFDNAILQGKYDILTSMVWEFEGFSNFAVTGGEALTYDLYGKQIQNLLDPSTPAGHIYLCIFPENNKTYAIIAWLKKYDSLFSGIKDKLLSLSP